MPLDTIRAVFRADGPRILAGLVRRFGDFGLAEDALQDAYLKALSLWGRDGLPDSPAAWLTTVAQRYAIDALRRAARQVALDDIAEHAVEAPEPQVLADDRLRLIFICCHPALAPAVQVALALRTLCGLTTREIARAFHEGESATAQRLVRAKRKIAQAAIPYAVPGAADLPARLVQARKVLYLMFNEGYAAGPGNVLLRADLCREAIRLARMLVESAPPDAETLGLLALFLLQHARHAARLDHAFDLVTLACQDRGAWDRAAIAEGLAALDAALAMRAPGPLQIQAAIAALHAKAPDAAETDWLQIAGLYAALLRHEPAPAVELNAAVAVALSGDTASGLAMLAELERLDALPGSHYLPAAQAELLRLAGDAGLARAAYERAIGLCGNDVERRHLRRRLESL